MKMLGLKETLDKMAKANGVRWYGHVVKRDDESILKKAMMFEVNGPEARTARANMEETSRKEYKDWVEGGGSYRSREMERGSEC